MEQPLNARGTYFGGGNRGFGTIIGREETGTFFDSALRAAQRQKADEEKAKTKREEKLAELQEYGEAKDVFSPYLDTSTNMLNEIIDEYAKGGLTDAELAMRVNDYRTLVYKGNQMKTSFEEISKLYEDDDRIDAVAAKKWARKQAAGDGSREYLTQKNKEGLNGVGFLDEEGGSAFLKPDKVISAITTNIATDIKQQIQAGDTSWLGGNVVMDKQQMKAEFSRLFEEEYTNEGVKFKLRDPNSPEAKEIIDSSLQDKYFSRIVYDQLREDNPDKESFTKDEARNKAIRILGGYSDTEVTVEDKSKNMGVRWKPEPRGSGKGDEEYADQRRTEWYNHLMSGDPNLTSNALNYMSGTTEVPFTDIRDIIPQKELDKLFAKFDEETITSNSFDITRAYINSNGKPVLKVVPKSVIGLENSFSNYPKDEPLEIEIDLRSSVDPEFWLKYYNISKTWAGTGSKNKPHYNENKGGAITPPAATPTPAAPPTPGTSSTPKTAEDPLNIFD